MAVLPMILLKKKGTGNAPSPLNSGRRPNTYAKTVYYNGECVNFISYEGEKIIAVYQ
jgi:hypothetical protein